MVVINVREQAEVEVKSKYFIGMLMSQNFY